MEGNYGHPPDDDFVPLPDDDSADDDDGMNELLSKISQTSPGMDWSNMDLSLDLPQSPLQSPLQSPAHQPPPEADLSPALALAAGEDLLALLPELDLSAASAEPASAPPKVVKQVHHKWTPERNDLLKSTYN